MPNSSRVIVDTNIIFSALLSENSSFSRTILKSEHSFYICESVFIELFKHKEKISSASKLDEDKIIRWLYTILKNINLCKESLIPQQIRQQAYNLCEDIDPADAPHIALTIHLDGLFWTGDKKLIRYLSKNNFHHFFNP
ncbi:MAG: PIN domain-containing protein [Desulfonatronovibrio sp.]